MHAEAMQKQSLFAASYKRASRKRASWCSIAQPFCLLVGTGGSDPCSSLKPSDRLHFALPFFCSLRPRRGLNTCVALTVIVPSVMPLTGGRTLNSKP